MDAIRYEALKAIEHRMPRFREELCRVDAQMLERICAESIAETPNTVLMDAGRKYLVNALHSGTYRMDPRRQETLLEALGYIGAL